MSRRLLALTAATLLAAPAAAQTPPQEPPKVFRGVGAVPDNMSRLSDTLTGSYFVSTPLIGKYEALLDKLDALKRDLDAGRLAGPEAAKSLAELRAGLKELREQIDKSKVMVAAVQAHSRTESSRFDIGPDRTVVINAERVRLIGTDGDQIVCTLEKVYLGGDAKEADAQLAEVKVAHNREVNRDKEGPTQAEEDAGRAKFLKTPAAAKYTPADFAFWAQTGAIQRAQIERYRSFWGKATDVITVEGVDSQPDSIVEMRTFSKGGGGIARQARRRYATLTVAVPKCQRVAVGNARISLEVAGLQGSLFVTNQGNGRREFDGQFTIKGVRGDVDAVGYPFSAIEDVSGSVTLICAEDSAGTGFGNSAPQEGLLMVSRGRPAVCAIRSVGGDLRGRFGRVDVSVEGVSGATDVSNDAGDTKLVVKTPLPAKAAHRLTSIAGTVEVSIGSGALGELAVIGATTFGTYRVKSPAITAITFTSDGSTLTANNFSGFSVNLPKIPIDAPVMLGGAYEPLRPGDKTPCLAIRTLAGHIVVTVADK